MKVEFVDLRAQYAAIKEEIDAAINAVITSSAYIGGSFCKSFEANFAAYLGVGHCVGVGNGTDALSIALKTLGIGHGHEVITVANSFIATSEAITQTGGRVVFVDCDAQTYNIDPTKIEQAITAKTRVIIPVHLYGQPADMDIIMEIARRHKLFVVEDAAQAHGAHYKGRAVGTFGQFACYSFFPGKNLGAYGDAGAIVTNDKELAQKARMYANHGRIEKYNHEMEGVNSRLDGLQAAILDVKLRHLEHWTTKRREIAEIYDRELAGIVETPYVADQVRHVYHLYVVRTPNRDRIQMKLKENGVATGIHYPIPLPFLKAYASLNHKPDDFPVANRYKDEILSLPIHGSMRENEVAYVIDNLKAACKAR